MPTDYRDFRLPDDPGFDGPAQAFRNNFKKLADAAFDSDGSSLIARVWTAADAAGMTSLSASRGDMVFRTDEGVIRQLTGSDPSVAGDWQAFEGQLDTHIADQTNPHAVSASQAGAVANSGNAPSLQTGTLGNRPAAGTAGAVYVATDNQVVYYDNGGGWVEIGRAAGQIAAGDLGFDPATQTELDGHTTDQTNPHAVSASQAGAIPDQVGAVAQSRIADDAVNMAKVDPAIQNTANGLAVLTSDGRLAGNLQHAAIAGAPSANDDDSNSAGNGSFVQNDLWLDTVANIMYVCVDSSTGAADWREVFTANAAGEFEAVIVHRNDTAANLASIVPSEGEVVYETDTKLAKVGDGVTQTQNLAEFAKGTFVVVESNSAVVADPANGDARGDNAVDFQSIRFSDTEVASGIASVIGGGVYNTASSYYSTVGGGLNNTASIYFSTVGGGKNNTASGTSATVGGGRNNTASGGNATVGGGTGNTASIYFSTVGGGRNNTASSYYSTVGGGLNNTASGDRATVPGGKEAIADKYGQMAHASGEFSNPGDAQVSSLIARNQTTDGSATNLFLDGGNDRLTIPTDTAWMFDLRLIAAEQDMANIKKFHRTGAIVNDGGTITISSIDTIGTDQTIGSPGAWSVAVSADDTNDALDIQVTGEAGTNIRWVAEVQLQEVSYPA